MAEGQQYLKKPNLLKSTFFIEGWRKYIYWLAIKEIKMK